VLISNNSGQPVAIEGIASDITDRKEAEAALQKSEALFRAFFQTNPVATIITSTSGLVHMVNPAFTSRTDFSAEEVVGRTAQELGFWRDPEDRNRMVAAIKEHGFIDNLESSFYGKDNKPMTCIVSSRAIEYEGEVRMLSIVIDVTEQRKAEEALRKLDQAKSDFISTAAHELRTPLIAIVGYSELLGSAGKNTLTEEQKESYISIIQDQAEDLNHLVDNLLDVGRIQVGRSLGIVPREVGLAGIIDKVVEALKMKSRRHNILVAHYNPLPETIWIDGPRITQVLNNLLANAIKYSPQGNPIKVQTMTDEDKVTVSIVDQGIGMTSQQIEHIFDRFYRGEDAKSAASGLGLGMCIVEQIIADHGGEIFVSSAPDEGTTITFTLPIKQ
jgi:PAS domain S-box-containing protein